MIIYCVLINDRSADRILSTSLIHMSLAFKRIDSNCIQVLAPHNMEGCNSGRYEAGEHIGHLRRETSVKLAPILDILKDTNMLHTVTFECCLRDNDTSHARNGYSLHVNVMSSNTKEYNLKLLSLFTDSQL